MNLKSLIMTFSLLCSTSLLAHEETKRADIKYREELMHSLQLQLKMAQSIVKGEVPYKDHIKDIANSVAGITRSLKDAFPPSSKPETGKPGQGHALAAVWTKNKDFMNKLNELSQLAEEANKATQSKGVDGFKSHLKKLWGTCRSCHDDYKAK